MTVVIEPPKEALAKLRDELPRGAVGEIAKRAGCTRDFVYKVFSSKVNISEGAKRVIAAAQDIIKESIQATDALAKEIESSTFKRQIK